MGPAERRFRLGREVGRGGQGQADSPGVHLGPGDRQLCSELVFQLEQIYLGWTHGH